MPMPDDLAVSSEPIANNESSERVYVIAFRERAFVPGQLIEVDAIRTPGKFSIGVKFAIPVTGALDKSATSSEVGTVLNENQKIKAWALGLQSIGR